MRAAIGVPDRADPGEIGLALQIMRAGQGLSRHRVEHRLEARPVARAQQVTGFGDVDADQTRLLRRVEPGQLVGRDNDPPAAVERVDIDDAASDRDRPEAAVEHRRRALAPGLADQREAGGGEREARRGAAPHRPAARHDRGRDRRQHHRRSKPERRLDRQREVERYYGAKSWKQTKRPGLEIPI